MEPAFIPWRFTSTCNMSHRPVKSTARLWAQAPGPDQKYRDRKRVKQPDGKYREFVGYGRTARAATDDLYDKLNAAAKAARETALVPTVNQVTAAMLRHKRAIKGRKRKTIHNDLELFKRHVRPFIGHKTINDVTLEDMQEIQANLTTAGKYRTAELTTIQLRSIWRFAVRQYRTDIQAGRLVLFNVAEDLEQVRRPAEAQHRPNELWTVEDLSQFLTEARRIYDSSVQNLLYPLFHTAIAAGLRRGELLGLHRSDFITSKGRNGAETYALRVRQQLIYYAGKHHQDTPKSASGERIVPIGPELAAVLQAHIAKLRRVAKENPEWEDTPLLFPSFHGGPIQPRSLYRARDTVLAAINKNRKPHEPEITRATLHDLRGLYATYVTRELVQQGRYSPKLVMQLLGHSHPDIALRHYSKVVQEDLAGATFDPFTREELSTSLPTDSEAEPNLTEEQPNAERERTPAGDGDSTATVK